MAWLYPLSALIPLAIQEKPWSWLVSGILLLMTLLVRHRVLSTLRSTLLSLRADLAAGGVQAERLRRDTRKRTRNSACLMRQHFLTSQQAPQGST